MKDDDLNFLITCSDDELAPLVDILLGKEMVYSVDGYGGYKQFPKGRFSSELQDNRKFRQFYPQHSKYVSEIVDELQLFGGNTLVNKLVRDNSGILYRQIVSDVAKRLKVERQGGVEEVELAIWERVLGKAVEKENATQVRQLCEGLADFGYMPKGSSVARAVLGTIKLGGFKAYQMNVCLANLVARSVTGRGLSLAANATLTKTMSILVGPLGWAFTVFWTIKDIAAEAYRVTVPAVVYIGALRQIKKYQQQELKRKNELRKKRIHCFLRCFLFVVGLAVIVFLILKLR